MFRTAALIVLAGASCTAFSDTVEWIAGAKHTYIVLPPQSITDGSVQTASYSSDGAYLLVGERPIIPDQDRALDIGKTDQAGSRAGSLSLLVWDRLHRQIKTNWTTEDPTVKIDNVHWINGTPTAIIVMRSTILTGPVNKPTTVWAVMALNAATGKFEWISGLESLTVVPKVFVSPSKPTALVAFDSFVEEPKPPTPGRPYQYTVTEVVQMPQLYVSTANGTPSQAFTIQMPLRADEFVDLDGSGRVVRRVHAQPRIEQNLVWSTDGLRWLLSTGASKVNPGGLSRLNDDGSLDPVNETAFKSMRTPQDLSTTTEVQVAKHGKTQVNYDNLWLVGSTEADHSELLLAPNGEAPTLSPATDSVYYIEGGVAKVRLILSLPPEAGQALRDAEKLRAQAGRMSRNGFIPNHIINITGLKFVITGTSAPPDKP